MHKHDFDWNLIKILDALFRHRNVSRAADELGQTQSTVSHALARARDHFGDPLFVRASKGMTVTRFGASLEMEVAALVKSANALGARKERFDPAHAEGRIVIAATEYFEIVTMPRVVARLEREAPGIQLSIRSTGFVLPKSELETGQFHCAVAGFFRDMPEGFFLAGLFSDTFSTVVRRGHPGLAQGKLTKSAFFQYRHALITLRGDFEEVLPRKEGENGRRFTYGTSSFTSIVWVVEKSDLILTAPTRLVDAFRDHFDLVVMPPPVEFKPIRVKMVWHARTDSDPLFEWIRKVLREESKPPDE